MPSTACSTVYYYDPIIYKYINIVIVCCCVFNLSERIAKFRKCYIKLIQFQSNFACTSQNGKGHGKCSRRNGNSVTFDRFLGSLKQGREFVNAVHTCEHYTDTQTHTQAQWNSAWQSEKWSISKRAERA